MPGAPTEKCGQSHPEKGPAGVLEAGQSDLPSRAQKSCGQSFQGLLTLDRLYCTLVDNNIILISSSIRNAWRVTAVNDLLTLEELANYLRVTEKTIYRLLDKRSIPATKVGRQWRFDKAAIDSWLRQNSTEGASHILVIDDEETICSLFKDTLEYDGYIVTTLSQSSQALELIQNGDYDLVFLDLMLPGVNGAELFRHIREIKPDLPVTIITGYPDSELMMKALNYGPLGAMKKPFDSSDVLAAVHNYVRFSRLSK
jgi:excisionase family DNA binding protein